MKPIPCTIIINTRLGYCLTPVKFPSIRQAYQVGKDFCGFAFRIYDRQGKLVRRGFCDS
jgi:hypothetical protein